MAIVTTGRSTVAEAAMASDNLLLRRLLILSLSLSPASKVFMKHGGGARQKQHRAGGGGAGGEFRCKTCARVFPTFQALGGHRTSHKRPMVRANGLDLLLGARPGKGAAAAGDVHRCSTCGAVFPTGQALGGHMRRHRAAAAAFDFFDVAVHGETATRDVVDDACLSGEQQGESEDDDARSVRLFKFI